jgi:hypothetical protein
MRIGVMRINVISEGGVVATPCGHDGVHRLQDVPRKTSASFKGSVSIVATQSHKVYRPSAQMELVGWLFARIDFE